MVKFTAFDRRNNKSIAQIETDAPQGSVKYRKASRLAHKYAENYRKKNKLSSEDVGVHIDLFNDFPHKVRVKKKV